MPDNDQYIKGRQWTIKSRKSPRPTEGASEFELFGIQQGSCKELYFTFHSQFCSLPGYFILPIGWRKWLVFVYMVYTNASALLFTNAGEHDAVIETLMIVLLMDEHPGGVWEQGTVMF